MRRCIKVAGIPKYYSKPAGPGDGWTGRLMGRVGVVRPSGPLSWTACQLDPIMASRAGRRMDREADDGPRRRGQAIWTPVMDRVPAGPPSWPPSSGIPSAR